MKEQPFEQQRFHNSAILQQDKVFQLAAVPGRIQKPPQDPIKQPAVQSKQPIYTAPVTQPSCPQYTAPVKQPASPQYAAPIQQTDTPQRTAPVQNAVSKPAVYQPRSTSAINSSHNYLGQEVGPRQAPRLSVRQSTMDSLFEGFKEVRGQKLKSNALNDLV
jgi:hypothetical protein